MKNNILDRLNSSAPSIINLTKVKDNERKNIFKNHTNHEEMITISDTIDKVDNDWQRNVMTTQRNIPPCNNSIFHDLFDDDEEMCRICHSESGILISPCICQGSMGFIHDNCLIEWIKTSGKRTCELCGTKYHAKKKMIWNFFKWSKPNIDCLIYFKAILVFLNIILLQNCLSIINERKFFKRIFIMKLLPRYHDILPLITMIITIIMLLRLVKFFIHAIKQYLDKQKVYKFTNF
ncbi:Zinc finger, RING-CH-type domain and Zinc finger, RING/FYVE/PHD-type domain-containing protein [Strongyloides ratti]|uniref:Zinc finger, RING-CH-type domain and Zinc finger, RING/FYVE/PHD-type domain-containing protein n=1 Tax=Strongyloides ratti TaxID=34506 RepID=A0A090KV22_STRRB|nr:Zinc finger, RING-CH-type domain and Zinc finger, RING/FYVE/PHD-type domain-containing protein [Strongyloides ratti]CEF61246.1 Zinc finger, RING-CH-type domain and Zinc finger, RING/FYVE/PHD-type domain-containing protein [Strongyloides ratti]